MANMHSARLTFTHSLVTTEGFRSLPASHPAPAHSSLHSVPRGPLLRKRYLPSTLLRPHVPIPKPLPNFAFTLAGQSLQLGPSAAGLQDLPDVTVRESFPGCLDLYPGCPWGASTRFFPQGFGLPRNGSGSALCKSPHNDFSAGPLFQGCSHFLMFRPPGLLATQVVPTAASFRQGGHDVYFRAPYESLPLHTSDMLAVRFGQLTAGDFHPIRLAA